MKDQGPLLILGGSGLLGRYVVPAARRLWEGSVHSVFRSRPPVAVEGIVQHRVNLADARAVARLLEEVSPDVVLNCAGLTSHRCNDGHEAVMINAALPQLVARSLGTLSARLVQVSTDCVFSGRRGGYGENDLPDPVDLYGRTKLAGEILDGAHLTVRTSFVGVGPQDDKGLLSWFLAQKGVVKGYRGCLWSGLTADTLSEKLVELAKRTDVCGIIHICGESIDKASLLSLAATAFNKRDVHIEPVDIPKCDRTMVSHRMEELGIVIPPISMMLTELAVLERRNLHDIPGVSEGRR